jgi:hypothetical protein
MSEQGHRCICGDENCEHYAAKLIDHDERLADLETVAKWATSADEEYYEPLRRVRARVAEGGES